MRDNKCSEIIASAWVEGGDVCSNISRTSAHLTKWSNNTFGNFAKEMGTCSESMKKLMEEEQSQENIDQMRALDEQMDE